MSTTKPKVFYDGGCPVCSREISFYQKQKNEIEWVDVNAGSSELPDSLSQEDALARFHVMDEDGKIRGGAAAFSYMWLKIPKFQLLGKFTALPIISNCFELSYRLFLKVRKLYR